MTAAGSGGRAAERGLRVGLTQWHVTADIGANLAVAERLIARAAADGADVVVLPENALMLGTNTQMRDAALAEDSPEVARLGAAARAAGATVVLGGMKNRTGGGIRNSALVFAPDGTIAARYDKLHLFDARIGGQSFEASTVEQPGDELVTIDVAGVRLGLTICYDVRFPEVARALALAGAEVLLVPSAFVQRTGEAHWHTLLRARAIENHAFVVASATVHSPDDPSADAFATYGHALAVGPWGEVLADLGEAAEAVQVVRVDPGEVARARATLPVLAGRRDPAVYAKKPRVVPVRAHAAETMEANA